MFALALLLAAAPAPDPEALRQVIIARCGIAADRLAVEPWTDPPEEVLVVKGDELLPDGQLSCLGAALSQANVEGYPVAFSFDDFALGKRYSILRGREGLAQMGLLDRLPVYDAERETRARFARRLERLCKARPGSLLIVRRGNIRVRAHVFDDPKLLGSDAVVCAVNALEASGFNALGMPEAIYVPVTVVTTPAS